MTVVAQAAQESQQPPSSQKPGASTQKPSAAPTKQISPQTPVITVETACAASSASAKKPAGPCRTVVTRAQFETLAQILNPNMPPGMRQQFGEQYARLLAFAAEARRMRLDAQPRFREILQFARNQVLASEYMRVVSEQASKVPEQEVEAYYRGNNARFEEASLQRIFIPRSYQIGDKPADEAAIKELAQKIRGRFAAGEEADKLQEEIFTMGGMKTPAPGTKLGERRRGSLPPEHEKVFDLRPETISEVITDRSGAYIYKVLAKSVVPLEKARAEIQRTLQQQKVRDTLDAASGKIQLNSDYFSAAASPSAEPSPNSAPQPR
jgi:hypothetical protein